MILKSSLLIAVSIALVAPSGPLAAQVASATSAEATDETAVEMEPEAEQEALLTEEELDDLVAPIALYPDTLLIQILVGATLPVEIIKANRFVEKNEGMEQQALNEAIEAEGWDPSVVVLAQGFPTVLTRMSEHIDWTELAGSAMLVQSDDVMAAIQRMREQAETFGNLETTAEQTISRDETDSIVITPTDPEVIYVPTYNTTTVYYRHDPTVVFLTWITIGAIWHNNNNWHGYWGCHNCGGWGGQPIHYRPTNININGNVNIGNSVNIGNRGGTWQPNTIQQARARNTISDRKANYPSGGKTARPLGGETGRRNDALRRDLSNISGASDISRPRTGDRARPGTGNTNRPVAGNRTRTSTGIAARSRTGTKPNRTPSNANRSTSSRNKATRPSQSRQPTTNRQRTRSNAAFQSSRGAKSARRSSSRGASSRQMRKGSGGRKRR